MAEVKGVMLYFNYREPLNNLSMSERGELLTALLDYGEKGTIPEFSGGLKMLFDCIKPTIDSDIEKYIKRCKINKNNSDKRYNQNQSNANDNDCNQSNANDNDCNQSNANDNDCNQSNVNKIKENKIKENKSNKYSNKESLTIPDEILEAWNGFIEMRKRIKKPLTDRAEKLALNKLINLSNGDYVIQNAILDQSTEHCWSDLYPLKKQSKVNNTKQNNTSADLNALIEVV